MNNDYTFSKIYNKINGWVDSINYLYKYFKDNEKFIMNIPNENKKEFIYWLKKLRKNTARLTTNTSKIIKLLEVQK